MYSRSKTELTRVSKLLYVFYFSKNLSALRPQTWRQKIRLNLLGGSLNHRTQQLICRSAHLLTIGIESIRVKHRIRSFFPAASDLRQRKSLIAIPLFYKRRCDFQICQGAETHVGHRFQPVVQLRDDIRRSKSNACAKSAFTCSSRDFHE
jgi:hypothetical protein